MQPLLILEYSEKVNKSLIFSGFQKREQKNICQREKGLFLQRRWADSHGADWPTAQEIGLSKKGE
jgi:hypothetical protein